MLSMLFFWFGRIDNPGLIFMVVIKGNNWLVWISSTKTKSHWKWNLNSGKIDGKCQSFLFLFREKGREGERGRETLMCERNIHQLPLACPQLGTWLSTQVCALAGNWTGDLLVHKQVLNPLSHTSQGCFIFISFFPCFFLRSEERFLIYWTRWWSRQWLFQHTG